VLVRVGLSPGCAEGATPLDRVVGIIDAEIRRRDVTISQHRAAIHLAEDICARWEARWHPRDTATKELLASIRAALAGKGR
jgi:hypothetical protein